jgi:hypothetical protein
MTPPPDLPPHVPSSVDREPDVVVRGPAALPVVVPHLVGFVPSHSFVVLGHAAGSDRAAVTMRFDLPPGGLTDSDFVRMLHAWEDSFGALERSGATSATVVLYPAGSDELWSDVIDDDLPHRELVELVAGMVVQAGCTVRDSVCVVGDRVRSYLCESPGCCPPEGTVADPSEVLRIQAALVGVGSAPLPSREALVDALAARPDGDPVREAVEHARPGALARQPSDVIEQVESFLHAVARWDRQRDASDRERRFTRLVATAGLLVTAIAPRDYLLRELAVECDSQHVEAVRSVLAEAVRCTSGPELAGLAAVLAVAAWLTGDGAAARVALDRSLDADPTYSLAHLVTEALDHGLPPWSWRESMRGLTAEAILAAARPGRERWPA